jgi:hypothetical protein
MMNERDLQTIHSALSTYAVRTGVDEAASSDAASLAAFVWTEICRRSVIRAVVA